MSIQHHHTEALLLDGYATFMVIIFMIMSFFVMLQAAKYASLGKITEAMITLLGSWATTFLADIVSKAPIRAQVIAPSFDFNYCLITASLIGFMLFKQRRTE
jgi:hypothetical protein